MEKAEFSNIFRWNQTRAFHAVWAKTNQGLAEMIIGTFISFERIDSSISSILNDIRGPTLALQYLIVWQVRDWLPLNI